MKKITFCAYDKPDSIGGPVTWLQLLLPDLKQRGFDVSCLIIFHLGNTGPLYEHLTASGVKCKITTFKPYTEENIKFILDCVKEDPPHIFVPNLVVPAYYAAKWIKAAGIHTVGISHSDDPFYHALQKEFMDGENDFRLSGMVCVSSALEKQLKASPYANKLNIVRIPYGVHIPDSKAQRHDDELRVVYVGRLAEEQKRISEVALAFCRMTTQIANTTAAFYGDGPDRANVETIIAKEGNDSLITIIGSIPAQKVQEALLKAHVIVLLSDFEGLPIAVLEAMACGVVPVSLNMRSGINEQITHGETGFLVNDRESDFLNTIKYLQNNQEKWEEVSKKAKAHIKNHFAIDLCHQTYADYFSSFSNDLTTKKIEIPKRFRLPPVNLNLARADKRKPNVRIVQSLKLNLGLLKHRLSNCFK